MGSCSVAGQVHDMIRQLIDARANGDAMVATTTRTKLLLKGVRIQDWTPQSPDDEAMLKKVRAIAAEMGITL